MTASQKSCQLEHVKMTVVFVTPWHLRTRASVFISQQDEKIQSGPQSAAKKTDLERCAVALHQSNIICLVENCTVGRLEATASALGWRPPH